MKKISVLIPKIVLLAFTTICISACIKNDNFIKGDAKIRIFNNVINDTSQNFYFNNEKLQNALSYSTNSGYLVVIGEQPYVIEAKNNITSVVNSTTNYTFPIGKNYSIYYTRDDSTTKPKMVIYEDTVRKNLKEARIMFINVGYTLNSGILLRNEKTAYKFTLTKGQKTEYISITNPTDSGKFVCNLVDSALVVDTIAANNFVKGNVYTIIFDGTKSGKLRYRVVTN